MMVKENFTESSSYLTNGIRGRTNPINSNNTEQVTLATRSQRKDRGCKTSVSRLENKPPALAFHGKSNKLLKYQWKWDHERAVLNTQNLLMVRLQSKWKGHTITVHPFDWETFKANEKNGHRLLTRTINFIKYRDQYVKDNPEDLKDMDQICASWDASPCAGDNPYRAKVTMGDPRLLDYSSRYRQLQRQREKKRQHMRRTKERQEKSEKLSMIEDQIEELTDRVSRHQFSCASSPSSNL
ncbi:uncharacterized protein Bfra_012295 [Botrytis fragariae]|uniref:Uncharacterized protein n=1 Tax=Botrytis fragariae TaxID=1964551 RepID=A0A8H6AJP2_9HELO|nr:uncharacterized protein Bfra_012295 [Botrytis fragariae]KAF5868647.1 hypothetical protein Bfra_012295 [Botrytis fragariae]